MDNLEKTLQMVNVLVVDDMESIRSLVNSCLKEIGVKQVCISHNGDDAWKKLQNTRIDIIICDWDMPKVSGLDLLKLIRGSDKHSHIPFLMLTATTEKESVVNALEVGVSDYLSKPFQPKELEYRFIKLLRKVKLP